MNLFEAGEAFIQHYFDQAYDPVKAHQYYEDNKNLKGRQPGKTNDSSGKRTSSAPISKSNQKAVPSETAAQRKAKLDADTAALKARLEELRALLKSLVAEAKRRSGIEVGSDGKTATEPKKANDLTPAQEAEKAAQAHDYYEKTKGTLPSQESTHVLKQKIALIEKKIAEIRAQLAKLGPEITTQVKPTVPVGAGRLTTEVGKGDSQNGS